VTDEFTWMDVRHDFFTTDLMLLSTGKNNARKRKQMEVDQSNPMIRKYQHGNCGGNHKRTNPHWQWTRVHKAHTWAAH
jgi:uncharacterized membrane protein